MIDTLFIPCLRDGLVFQEVEGESLVLDNSKGLIHQLNGSAAYILTCCNGEDNIQSIIDHVIEKYSIDKDTASNDVFQAISSFKKLNFINE